MEENWYAVEQQVRDRLNESPGGRADWSPDPWPCPIGASPELRRDHDHSSGELGLGSRNAVVSGALTRARQRARGDEITSRERTPTMHQEERTMHHRILPISCKPYTLNWLPERLIVSHYENNYDAAVGSLNAVRDRLAGMDPTVSSAAEIRALKREELSAISNGALQSTITSLP